MRHSVPVRLETAQVIDSPQLISVRGHHILADLINSNSVVIDLGAHFGQFSSEMNVRFGAQCYAVEANPALCSKIPEIERIRRFNCAISGKTGAAMFDVSENLECSHLSGDGRPPEEAIEVRTSTLTDFVQAAGITKIDLLKVDIEGAEFEMFDSVTDEFLQSVGQITIEFHDFIAALACEVAVARVKARLRRLGFSCTVFSRSNNGDVLFVNRAFYRATPVQWFYLENIARFARGLARLADRWLHPITASGTR